MTLQNPELQGLLVINLAVSMSLGLFTNITDYLPCQRPCYHNWRPLQIGWAVMFLKD